MTSREQANAKVADFRRRAAALDEIANAPGPDVPEHGQPILVGHHSERAHRRMMERAAEAWDRQAVAARHAVELRRRANALEAQTARTVFDDDPDAVSTLEAQIVGVERMIARLQAGEIESIGPLQRKDAIRDARRQIRGCRQRIERITSARGAKDGDPA